MNPHTLYNYDPELSDFLTLNNLELVVQGIMQIPAEDIIEMGDAYWKLKDAVLLLNEKLDDVRGAYFQDYLKRELIHTGRPR